MTKKKKKIRNARVGKNSLLSLNVTKMLVFFLWKNKTSRTYCRETTLSMSKRSRILQDFFSTVVNQLDAVGEAFWRNPPKDTCQKSKSIKVFCYIRFGPMLKTFCNERKFGRFWDGKFKCYEYETGKKVWRLRKVGVCWHLRALFGITIEEFVGKMNGFTNRQMYFDDTSWQNYRLTKTNGTLKNTKTTSWIPLGTDHIKSICNVIITTQLNNECHVYIKHWTIFSSNKREREST